MLNRSQIQTMLMLRNRSAELFFQVPVELIRKISELGQNPDSDFDKAIKHAARGELSEVKTILEEANSREDKTKLKELLLSSGTAVTRCGLTIKHKTLLECALGEGDREMIWMVKSYFLKFKGGEEEMERQLERYRPCIEAIQKQKPDDLTWLFEIIKKSSLDDVKAELAKGDEYNVSHQSELRTALNKFREQKLDPKVRVITEPQMHCKYQNLMHAYDMFDSNWDELREWVNKKQDYNYDKRRLVARQVIGFIQLVELPAYERYLCARDQVKAEAAGERIQIERTVKYKKYYSDSFPDFDVSLVNAHVGLGFDSYSSTIGLGLSSNVGERSFCGRYDHYDYVEQKQRICSAYAATELQYIRAANALRR